MDRNVTDHKIDTILEKEKSGSQKRLKGKGKATDSAVTTTHNTGISTTDETIMFNKVTLDDYDLEYSSDNFDAPVVKRHFLDESTKSAFRITKSTSAAVESSTTASKTKAYFEDAGYTPPNLPHALYEYTKIQTAYYNNIKTHFGNKLRGLINKLFKKKEKAESLRGEMQANKSSSKAIKEAARKKIYRLCDQVKLAIAKKGMSEVGLLDDQSRTQLNGFLSSYPEDYTFQENSIYHDVMASPKNQFKVLFRLAELSEAEQMKQFDCFPLRTTFIPCYMTLDSKIIHYHVLKCKKNPKTGSKFETWDAVSLRFQGTLETDGVGVFIIKQNTDTSRKSPKPNTEKKVDGNQTEHIEGLGQVDLKSTEGKCVLIDPRRRDLMYCMKETSTVEGKQTLIFTKNNRSKCSRHFRYLRKRTQPFVDQKAEAILSRSEFNSVDLKKFVQYIKIRASVKTTLYEYYGNETTKSKETYFPIRI
ncbi:hypothetical protein G6F37_001162 [Rhizopus arrhizus]|nr:hypothetical protein G6F38_008988 [Rhizopus arrhizus]KAG1163486.1 hypothetical protein G6F37_001162 [Rhizopus arrhizus]